MIWFLLVWLALVLIRPQDYPAMAEMGVPILPIAMLAALAAWAIGRDRRPLDQPTYLLFPAFVAIGMLSMAFNGWPGGAVVRWPQSSSWAEQAHSGWRHCFMNVPQMHRPDLPASSPPIRRPILRHTAPH